VPDVQWTLDQLKRQAAQHLESLRQAGVQWLPSAPPLQLRQVTAAPVAAAPGLDRPHRSPPNQPLEPVTAAPQLFAEAEIIAAPASEELSLEQRRTELKVLAARICSCTRCPELASTRTQTVFADGQIPVELCLIGEAPGGDEDAQGLPFVGAAGQMLNKILVGCGFKREEVYICNVIKCRPPGNRTPKPEEIANCNEYLTRQLELVQPKFICALGLCAAQAVLKTTSTLGRLRGRFHDYNGIPVLCTYHPSYILPHRSPEKKRDVWEDMKLLVKRMGRQIPNSKQGAGE
jgi:uracil-DNA glycosylase